MRRKLFRFGLLAAAAMLPAGAGELNRSWELAAQILRPGAEVVATTMAGGQVEGKLLSITPDSISIVTSERPDTTLAREDVFRVREAGVRRRHALIGGVIGAVPLGILTAGAARMASGNSAAVAGGLGGALMGFGVGAAAGAAVPIGPPLYEASAESRRAWLKSHPSR